MKIIKSNEINLFTIKDDDTRLMAIFQDNLGKPVPECFHVAFYWSSG